MVTDEAQPIVSPVQHISVTFMVYGRVIGNELRDVPPEYLPIWGQRWSGYRAPHGPSPFSTRVFSADRMSEVGPVLTSPTQFEVTLVEEAEDACSESSQFHSFFLSESSLSITPAAMTKPPSRHQTPVPVSVRRRRYHPHHNLDEWHRSIERPSPTSARSGSGISRQRSEQCGTRHSVPEPVSHAIPIQGGCGSLETLWNVAHTPTGIQPRDNYPYTQHNTSLIPGGQFPTAHILPPPYSIQPDTPLHPDVDCLSFPHQNDDQTAFIPTESPPSHCFAAPLPQQNNDPVHSSRINVHPGYPVMSPWSTYSDPPSSWPLQNSTPSPELRTFYHLASDHHGRSTHSKGFS